MEEEEEEEPRNKGSGRRAADVERWASCDRRVVSQLRFQFDDNSP